jgi:hypothetical protein
MSRGEKPEVGSDATDLGGSFAIVSQNAPVARTNARVHDLQLSQDFRLDIDVPYPSSKRLMRGREVTREDWSWQDQKQPKEV